MPVAWDVDCALRRARLTLTDPYTFEEWRSAMRLILQHPDYRSGFHFLVDQRECTPPTTDFVRGAIDFLTTYPSPVTHIRGAAVVKNEPTAFGMVRMSELMAESNGIDVAIYTCTAMDDAELWLGNQSF